MVGDGSVGHYPRCGNYEITVTGHIITDKEFLEYVRKLKKKLFNMEFGIRMRPKTGTCVIYRYSIGLLMFYNKVLGLPLGSKRSVGVPDIIRKSDIKLKRAFLRGLADTDMTVVFKKMGKDVLYYPVIKLGTSSKQLVLDTRDILEDVGF